MEKQTIINSVHEPVLKKLVDGRGKRIKFNLKYKFCM